MKSSTFTSIFSKIPVGIRSSSRLSRGDIVAEPSLRPLCKERKCQRQYSHGKCLRGDEGRRPTLAAWFLCESGESRTFPSCLGRLSLFPGRNVRVVLALDLSRSVC